MSDEWDKPTPPTRAPLAPGVRAGGPVQPRPQAEPIELIMVDPDEVKTIEDLRLQNKKLRRENDMLMSQVEEAWAVIKTRDEQLQQMGDR